MWLARNSAKNYLLILGGTLGQRERALVGARKAFAGPIVATTNFPHGLSGRFYDDLIVTHECFPEECLRGVVQYERETGFTPAAVFCLNDTLLNSARSIADHYGLPFLNSAVIENCRNKDLTRQIFLKNGLPTVESRVVKGIEEIHSVAKEIGFPFVLKPRNFAGSSGVVKVESADEIETAFQYTNEQVHLHGPAYNFDTDCYVIEPYIEAPHEVSVEVLNNGSKRTVLGVTQKFICAEPYFAEIGHLVPSQIDSAEIRDIAIRACEVLEIDRGLAHVEMKIDRNGKPILLEVGPRPGGDCIMDLYESATGQNLYELHAKSFLDSTPIVPATLTHFQQTAIFFLHAPTKTIKEIRDLAEAPIELTKDVKRLTLLKNVGDIVTEAKDFTTRNGFVEFMAPRNSNWSGDDLLKRTEAISNFVFSGENYDS